MKTLGQVLRLTVVYLTLGALGCWSVWAQLTYRTPSRYVAVMLAGLAAVGTGLTLAFWLYAMFHGVGAAARRLTLVAVGRWVCALVVLGFTFYGLFLFTNGRFDVADPAHYPTEVVSIGLDETELGVTVPFVWAGVRSWRRPGEIERILLRPDERERLWGGQAVVVTVRPGFYNVAWVSRIDADVEKRSREVLAELPEASQIRKDLAEFYVRLGRYTEAAITTREYARRFPDDRAFPIRIAKLLTTRERFADVVTVLADVAPAREDADVYTMLGYSLGMQGRQAEGVPLLERARALQPRNWWPHYALGRVYGGGGDYARAVASFQKALELRPGLYDAEREIQRLRPLAARAK
jgi:tetratricopeptide (TPR) repeat protein